VIIFIGVSLALFILGDLVTSNTGLLNRNSDVVGEISGEKIRYREYESRVETLIENYKINTQNDNLDANTQDMLREQAWGLYVNDLVLGKQYDELGLSCSPEELYDMCVGKNPNQQVKQAFTDPKTGQFDPGAVIRFLKDLSNREESVQRQWHTFEEALKKDRVAEKYKQMIKSGLHVTTAEAKRNFGEINTIAAIRYVRLDYSTVADSAVSINENDLEKYYNENKNKYKQAETVRKIEYVSFDVTPSIEDREQVVTWINSKREELATTENPIQFVNQNSDSPFDSSFHAKGTLKPALDTVFFNASIGTIVGPYDDGGGLKVARLTAVKMVPDSVKARHILLKVEDGDTAAVIAKADSLKNLIKKGTKFDMLATMNSADPGSAIKGGDLGWFRQGMMVPSFNDACFNGNKGDMPIVTSQFGVHLIEITDKGPATKQIQVAVVERKFEPSQKTYDEMYNKAMAFASENQTAEQFDSAIVNQGLNKRTADNLRQNDKNIAGLDQPREVIRWAYEAKVGDVSKVFTVGDKYVIAHLVEVKDKGFLPLETVKDQVTAEVRKAKKAEVIIDKMKNAGTASIDDIAQKLNTTATDADNITLTNIYIPGIGNEAKLVGTVFGTKENKLTGPVRGENGVTIALVKSFRNAAEGGDPTTNQKSLADQLRSRSEYEVFNALKEKADIVDNRGRFF